MAFSPLVKKFPDMAAFGGGLFSRVCYAHCLLVLVQSTSGINLGAGKSPSRYAVMLVSFAYGNGHSGRNNYFLFARSIEEMVDIIENCAKTFDLDRYIAPELKFISLTTLEKILGGIEDEITPFSSVLLDKVCCYRSGEMSGTNLKLEEPYVEDSDLEPLSPDPSEGYFVPEDDFYLEEFPGLHRYRWLFNVTNFTSALRLDWDV